MGLFTACRSLEHIPARLRVVFISNMPTIKENRTILLYMSWWVWIGEYTFVAFLEIEEAFNNITPDAIIAALSSLKVKSEIITALEIPSNDTLCTTELSYAPFQINIII